MEYLTTAEMAMIWGVSQRRVEIFCKEGRVPGTIFKGKFWLIPSDAQKPEDPRKKRKNNNIEYGSSAMVQKVKSTDAKRH